MAEARVPAAAPAPMLAIVALLFAWALGVAPASVAVGHDPAVETAEDGAETDGNDPPEGTEYGTESDLSVADVTLAWGINNESNTAAYAPGTVNHFSAGRIADPGAGGRTLSPSDWRQHVGNVSLRKWDPGAQHWQPATWAGLRTDGNGDPLRAGQTFSNHQIVFSGGTGEVDLDAGTASVRWVGDVTVLYYSGMSFFYLTDPELEVFGGTGVLTAEVSGFASSQTDLSAWEPVPPTRVAVATLPAVTLGADGFTAEPGYRGVTVDTSPPQVRSGAAWGSFPPGFVAAMNRMGSGSYWYSSGGAADPLKPPLALTVGWSERSSQPPAPDTPVEPAAPPENSAPPDNSAPPPASSAPPVASDDPRRRPPVPDLAPVEPPPGSPTTPIATPALTLLAAPTTPAQSLGPPGPAAPVASDAWPWWAGGGLLLAAAACLLVPSRSRN